MRFSKAGGDHELEAQLRDARPEPRPEFSQAIADRVRPRRNGLKPGLTRIRLALAAALTALVLTPVAASAINIPLLRPFSLPNLGATLTSIVNIGSNNVAAQQVQYQCPQEPITVFVLGQIGNVDVLALVRAQLGISVGIEIVSVTQVGNLIRVVVCVAA